MICDHGYGSMNWLWRLHDRRRFVECLGLGFGEWQRNEPAKADCWQYTIVSCSNPYIYPDFVFSNSAEIYMTEMRWEMIHANPFWLAVAV